MSIYSIIIGNESGGRNIPQGNIGDINNLRGTPAQGYLQITDPTWNDFGGAATGYSSAIQAPFAVQAQVAGNIPVARWGPTTQAALAAAGYTPMPGETLGQMTSRYGETIPTSAPGGGSLPGAAGAVITAAGGSPATPGTSSATTPATSGGNSPATAGGGSTPFNTGTGAPVVITDIASAGTIGAGKVQSGLVTAGGDVVKTGAQLGATATSLTQSTFNAVSDFFIRGGLGLLALILIGLALWQFGRQQEIIA